jgi:hypothetical protein
MRDAIYLEDHEGLLLREAERDLVFAALRERRGLQRRRSLWAGLWALLGISE